MDPIDARSTASPAVGLDGPWLVGDIGGTNARLGWVAGRGARVTHVRSLPVAEHAGPVAAIGAYLAALQAETGAPPPRHAALAVASALDGDLVALTNGHWSFSRKVLGDALGLATLTVLNDFEALALALPRLGPQQLRWQGPTAQPAGTRAVVGPGTGLGVAGLVPTRGGWVALPGEGGHATLSAADDFEARLLDHARTRHAHVSAERLLSGLGLPLLHEAVVAVTGLPARASSASASAPSAQDIVERGLAGEPACARTLDVFCALLGGFAGNVALTLGARGGVYIGGGIVPRLGERFVVSRFRERFEGKGRYRAYLQAIPTPLIVDTLAALDGAAAAIEQHTG